MLRARWNKSWKQHLLYGLLPPITKTNQIRRTRHARHCWRRNDERKSCFLLWTFSYGRATLGPARTYNSSVRTKDAVWKICRKRWMIGTHGKRERERGRERERERESGKSVRALLLDIDRPRFEGFLSPLSLQVGDTLNGDHCKTDQGVLFKYIMLRLTHWKRCSSMSNRPSFVVVFCFGSFFVFYTAHQLVSRYHSPTRWQKDEGKYILLSVIISIIGPRFIYIYIYIYI